MAVAQHEVPSVDLKTGKTTWFVDASYPSGEVAPLTQVSDIGLATIFEVGNLAGPLNRILIPGSPLQENNASNTQPTEERSFLIDPSSDKIDVYFVKSGNKIDDVSRRGLGDDTITSVIFDAERVDHIATLQPGMYAKFTSKNGVVTKDFYTFK